MNELTKTQITIGLLAFFATMWSIIFHIIGKDYGLTQAITNIVVILIIQFVLLLVLSYVILALLQWVKIFDLKTNAILTLIVLVTVRILSETASIM